METERLILRPWREEDALPLYKYAKNPAVGPIAGWPPHTSVENSREVIRDILSAPETYAVVLKETNEPVGSVGIMFGDSVHSADMQDGDAEIGYWIGVPYWGKGLIPEAVNRLLRRCFEELEVKRVWCGYYDGNTKSRRVMDKCGFKFHHTEEALPLINANSSAAPILLANSDDMYVSRLNAESLSSSSDTFIIVLSL